MSQRNVLLPSSGLKNFLAAASFHGLLFDPKDEGSMFPQNTGKLLLAYMASYLRTL